MKEILYCVNCKKVLKPTGRFAESYSSLELEKDQELFNEVKKKFTKTRPDDFENWWITVYGCKCKKIIVIKE